MNDPLNRIASTERKLAEACKESSVWLSADGRVSELVAAGLLGLAPGTLKNQRSAGSSPPFYQLGGGGGKISYSLHDLSVWIEGMRCE